MNYSTPMKTEIVSFRISSEIKNSAKLILKKNGMSISELCQNVLEYVAETRKNPVKKELISVEDRKLINLARARFSESDSIPVKLEDL